MPTKESQSQATPPITSETHAIIDIPGIDAPVALPKSLGDRIHNVAGAVYEAANASDTSAFDSAKGPLSGDGR